MCIKIIKPDIELKYDINKSLEDQIVGYKQIVVDYEPNDPTMDKFLDEVERFCQKGISRPLNIKVKPNSYVTGAKIRSRIADFNKDMGLNDVIKTVVLSYDAVDKKLEELSNICKNGLK
jgi:hypothetical protein